MKRNEILETAAKIVSGHREQEYGSPENNFQKIADLWSAYLCDTITPEDVAAMMMLFKIGRLATGGGSADTWVDIAGYAACGGEIATCRTTVKYQNLWCMAVDDVEKAKSEAVKESADELCKGRVSNDPVVIAVQAELNMTKGKAKPEKCPYFCEKQRIKGWINSATPITEPITVCSGTREQDECTCGGDKSKCDFYPKDYSYGY